MFFLWAFQVLCWKFFNTELILWIRKYDIHLSANESMSDEKEIGNDEDKKEFAKSNLLSPYGSNLISMDSTSVTMPLSNSTTANLLQAYAARLSSDSDYAR